MRFRAAVVAGGALLWVAFFWLNEQFFSATLESFGAHWIFLPAALRVAAVILFEEEGALAVGLGSLLSVWLFDRNDGPLLAVTTSIVSGLAPYLGLLAVRRLFALRPDCANLTPDYLLALTGLCSFFNALLQTAVFSVFDVTQGVELWKTGVALFTGDCLGTLFLVALCSLALRGWSQLRQRLLIGNRI